MSAFLAREKFDRKKPVRSSSVCPGCSRSPAQFYTFLTIFNTFPINNSIFTCKSVNLCKLYKMTKRRPVKVRTTTRSPFPFIIQPSDYSDIAVSDAVPGQTRGFFRTTYLPPFLATAIPSLNSPIYPYSAGITSLPDLSIQP